MRSEVEHESCIKYGGTPREIHYAHRSNRPSHAHSSRLTEWRGAFLVRIVVRYGEPDDSETPTFLY
jgi:hypothetical protein